MLLKFYISNVDAVQIRIIFIIFIAITMTLDELIRRQHKQFFY